jgi:hypothetical protein
MRTSITAAVPSRLRRGRRWRRLRSEHGTSFHRREEGEGVSHSRRCSSAPSRDVPIWREERGGALGGLVPDANSRRETRGWGRGRESQRGWGRGRAVQGGSRYSGTPTSPRCLALALRRVSSGSSRAEGWHPHCASLL